MKTRMVSPLLLLVGLILGLAAMWVGASPIGASGDLVTGGWIECRGSGATFACNTSPCDPCITTTLESCSGHSGCGSGYIYVATCGAGGQYTADGKDGECPCASPCDLIESARCY